MSVKAGSLFLAALMQTLLWLAVLYADPFGMSSAADRTSEEIFLRLYPILYPGANERIEVVLIDEKQLPLALDGGNKQWPLRYDEFADLIRKVLARNPKGVFVDVLFDTGQEDAQPLRDLIDHLPPDGPPVVFADYDNTERDMLNTIRGLKFEGSGALRGVVELVAPRNHYVLGTGAGNGAASPAAVLYNATRPQAKLDLRGKSEFLLAWGNTVDPTETDQTCAPITADNFESRWKAFTDTAIAGLKGIVESPAALQGEKTWERMQPCPYHHVFYPRRLYRGDTEGAGAELEGAYVLIGAGIAGTNDTVESPVHGQLPGVFLHAMALDNLLKFHGPPFAASSGPQFVQALLIFMIAFGGGLLFSGNASPESRLGALGGLLKSAFASIVFLAVIAAILLFFLLVFRWAPYNWGGVAAIAFAVSFATVGTNLFVLLLGNNKQ